MAGATALQLLSVERVRDVQVGSPFLEAEQPQGPRLQGFDKARRSDDAI